MSSEHEPQITPEMKARYIERRRADLVTLEAALAKRDFDVIRGVAHQIKGNAATFSYLELEAHAIALEQASESSSVEICAKHIASIRDWLNAQALT